MTAPGPVNNGLRGGLPAPALPGSGPWGSPFSLFGGQPGDVPQPGQAELTQHHHHVRLHGAQLGAGAGQVTQLIGNRRSRPRRDQVTTPSVSVSAAKTRRQILPQPFLPPQAGTAARTRAVNSSGPRAASRAGSPPHRAVTTCSAASQVIDSNGPAHASVTTGQATDKKSRIRCTDAVAAVISWARQDMFGFSQATKVGDTIYVAGTVGIGEAEHHATRRELTADEQAAAVAALRELAGGRADLGAGVCGVMEGASEGELRKPLARQAAELCRKGPRINNTLIHGERAGGRV